MREIALNRGFSSLVDEEDFERISQRKWYATGWDVKHYAKRRVLINGRQIAIYMHREIMNAPKGVEVDHIDGNGLDNRKNNLRLCSHQRQTQNRKLSSTGNTSGFLGVCWMKREQRFLAQIQVGAKNIYLGSFKDPVEAALVRDEATRIHFAEFGTYNFPREGERPARSFTS